MGSHAADSKTAKAASTGAQTTDATLDANAAKNQQFADQTRASLFGTNTGGKYTGGTLSQYLDPNSTNTTALQGTYLNAFNNANNQLTQDANNAVQSTNRNLASRGMGRTPAGFSADQMRKAYLDASTQRGNLYSQNLQAQHGEAKNDFWNATNMLNSNADQTANLSIQGNQAAASNYASLYGTGNQQVQSGWAVAGQTLAQMGQAAGSVMAAR